MVTIHVGNEVFECESEEVDAAIAENLQNIAKVVAPDLKSAGCLVLRDEDVRTAQLTIHDNAGAAEKMTVILMSDALAEMLFGTENMVASEK